MHESHELPDDADSMSAADPTARSLLFAALEHELRQIARAMGGQPGHTMQPTALVNEAWLRLCSTGHRSWKDRTHFLHSAALTMRRILLDQRRRRDMQQRNGHVREPFDDVLANFEQRSGVDFLALDRALEELAREHPRAADYVHLRFFGSRNNEETSRFMGISPRTGDRLWAFARAWLQTRLDP